MRIYLLILAIIAEQLPFIVVCLIGLLHIRFGKGRWGWYIFGVILTIITGFGSVTFAHRTGTQSALYDSFNFFATAILFLPLFFFLTKITISKRDQEGNNNKSTNIEDNDG